MAKLTATKRFDVLFKDKATASVFDFNAFSDVAVTYEKATSSVVADLNVQTNNAGFAAGDKYLSIDHLIGSKFNDVLVGNTRGNFLSGALGQDTLIGGAGNDFFVGVDDDGADLINGGSGIDTVDYSHVTTPLLIALGNQNYYPQDQIRDVENAVGGSKADIFFGNASANVLSGNAGNDVFKAGNGNDRIFGGNDDDILWGEAGNDFLNGGNGNDTCEGGEGNDRLFGGVGDDKLFSGEGKDIVVGGKGSDFIALAETVATTDVVKVASGDSTPTAADPLAFDSIASFDLGTGSTPTSADQLDLDSNLIAPDTPANPDGSLVKVQGVATGSFAQYTISNGLISFYDNAGTTVEISLANAGDALSFLAATNEYLDTLPNGNTVAAIVKEIDKTTGADTGFADTIVFQDGPGLNDTVVQLQGYFINHTYSSVIVTGISNDGIANGAIWLV